MADRHALILFGHGSRDAAWREGMDAIAQRIRELRPGMPVMCGFLEFMQPDLAGAAAGLVASGATQVHVVPIFLGTGAHVRQDLPKLVRELASQHSGVEFTLDPAVGEYPEVIDAIAQVCLEAASE